MACEVGRSEIITGCVRIGLRKAEIRNEGICEGRDKLFIQRQLFMRIF